MSLSLWLILAALAAPGSFYMWLVISGHMSERRMIESLRAAGRTEEDIRAIQAHIGDMVAMGIDPPATPTH